MNKRREKIIFIIWSSLVFALLTGGRLPYLIFTLLMSICLYAYYSVHQNKKRLVNFFWISRKLVTVGDSLEFGYKLNNIGILPVAYAEVDCNIGNRLGNIPVEVIYINPFQIISRENRITCRHRGIYSIGGLRVKLRDVFQLFELKVEFDHNIQLEVYPKLTELSRVNFLAREFLGAISASHKIYEDYTSLESLRKYQPGDNVRKIHWKAFAKTNELQVKNYEISASAKISIILDGYKQSYTKDQRGELEEKAVEVAASLIYYCLSKGLNTTLISQWGERSYIESMDIGKLDIFLKELMRFRPKGDTPLDAVVKQESRIIPWGTTMIFIGLKLTDQLFYSLLSLKKKKWSVILMLIQEQVDIASEKAEKRLGIMKKEGIDYYIIDKDSDIRSILEDKA